MSRARQFAAGIGFVAALIGVQQGLRWAGQTGVLSRQSDLLKRQDLEPAAFFYTETPQALRAEKTVRRIFADPPATASPGPDAEPAQGKTPPR